MPFYGFIHCKLPGVFKILTVVPLYIYIMYLCTWHISYRTEYIDKNIIIAVGQAAGTVVLSDDGAQWNGEWWNLQGLSRSVEGFLSLFFKSLAQDKDRWRALVCTVMNLRVPQNSGISWLAENLLASQERMRSMELVKSLLNGDH